MNDERFDAVTKAIATPTRRGVLLLTGLALCGLAGLAARSEAEPRERKRRQRDRRREQRRREKKPDPPLYPDLQTLPPSELRLGVIDGAHVVRFTNTVWNAGKGRLELEAATSAFDVDAGEIYQNVYDKPIGGTRVARRKVDGEIVYHASHGHYHFANFASYQLLRQDDAGDYQPLGESIKTSFCITDNFLREGNQPRQYDSCERERQGLTPGWQDTYRWNLPEQWVVVGDTPLPDGVYRLRSIADPDALLDEGGGGGEENNAADTDFRIVDGQIQVSSGAR